MPLSPPLSISQDVLSTSSNGLSISPANLSPRNDTISPLSDDEIKKLDKLKASMMSIIDTQISVQLMEKLRIVLSARAPNDIVTGSRLLVETRKVLVDSMSAQLSVSKDEVAAFILHNPRPPTPLPLAGPLQQDDPSQNKLMKLHAAAISAVEQLLDFLHYLRETLVGTQHIKQAIAIAQVVKALKLALEANVNGGGSAPLFRSTSEPPPARLPSPTRASSSSEVPIPTTTTTPTAPKPSSNISLATSPPIVASTTLKRASGSNLPVGRSPRDAVLLSVDKSANEAQEKLEKIRNAALGCSQTGLMDAAKGVRFAKQELATLMESRGLTNTPDYKVEAIVGEDQLSTLRRTLGASSQKLVDQITALLEHVHASPYLDPRPVETSLSTVVRALIIPV